MHLKTKKNYICENPTEEDICEALKKYPKDIIYISKSKELHKFFFLSEDGSYLEVIPYREKKKIVLQSKRKISQLIVEQHEVPKIIVRYKGRRDVLEKNFPFEDYINDEGILKLNIERRVSNYVDRKLNELKHEENIENKRKNCMSDESDLYEKLKRNHDVSMTRIWGMLLIILGLIISSTVIGMIVGIPLILLGLLQIIFPELYLIFIFIGGAYLYGYSKGWF